MEASLASDIHPNLVFVYGTLKAGHGRSFVMESGGHFIWEGSLDGFVMYSLGSFPGIVRDHYPQEDGGKVHGELWAVDRPTLARLDQIEAAPRMYRREIVEVVPRCVHEKPADAWTYIFNGNPGTDRIESGEWPKWGTV